ncbi:MAG: methyltransferase family protein [Elusimicrobiota bacterium]
METHAKSDGVPALLREAALFVETRFYPLYYAYFAFRRTRTTWQHFGDARAAVLGLLHTRNPEMARIHALALFIYAVRFTLVPFCLLTMYALMRRNPSPRRFATPSDILFPFVSTTVMGCSDMIINTFDSLNDVMDDPLIPLSPNLLGASYALVVAGRILSAAGILCLGRSFTLYIEERPLVKNGVYRYLKHPIYIGYMLSLIGVLLRNSSRSMILFLAIAATLFAVRAVLEERRLSAAYPEYS